MSLKMRTAKKLAIFFSSLPREKAISILKHFNINSMELVASEIRSLGTIPQEVQSEVFQEISGRLVQGVDPAGGEDVAWQILNGVIGEEEAKKLLDRAKPRKPKPFSRRKRWARFFLFLRRKSGKRLLSGWLLTRTPTTKLWNVSRKFLLKK
jgi:flagellar motor switch protein FliG